MVIGPYKIAMVETGTFALDGGAMFGVVPKQLWESTNPPDERNRIDMRMRCLLIEGNKRRILVDTGPGNKMTEKQKGMYKLDFTASSLVQSLHALGHAPEDITDVILTHLHFDHAGGSTSAIDGNVRPTFPNAKYYVQRRHWEWAVSPTEKDRGSFLTADFLPLHEYGMLEFTDGIGDLFDGIELIPVDGHTEAQQLVRIFDGNQSLLYCGDLIPMAPHVALPYIMGYDLRPLVTLSEKKSILGRATDEGWQLFLEHDPGKPLLHIERSPKGFSIRSRSDLV